MPGLEGESTNKFQKLLKPLTKTPWRSFKSMLSKTFTKKKNNAKPVGLGPIRHELGTVYEQNIGSETGLNIPTNRGGLQNYLDNIDTKIELLGELIKKADGIEDRVERNNVKTLARKQRDRLWELKRSIRQNKIKNVAKTMALSVKGTLTSANGQAHVNEMLKKEENRSNALVKEVNENMNALQKQLDKSNAALNKAFGLNTAENVMPSQLLTNNAKPISLPLAPLTKPRVVGQSSGLTLRKPVGLQGGKTRRRR